MGIRRRASQPIGCALLARGKRVEWDVVPAPGSAIGRASWRVNGICARRSARQGVGVG